MANRPVDNNTFKVAVIGAGLVGSSWAIVFARAGFNTKIFEPNKDTRAGVLESISKKVQQMVESDVIENHDQILAKISLENSLSDAVKHADYIQESVFETTSAKATVSLEIDASMSSHAVVGSSSSGIPSSEFTQECSNRNRFMIAHPVNPPHLHKLVEIVPASWTDVDAVQTCARLMEKTGQVAIHVKQEIQGFILNRLQGVLLNEAWALFEEGSASIEDIDKALTHGLVPRWSCMGPFETIDLNAPGGIKDYAERLGPLYHSIGKSREGATPWSEELIKIAERERDKILPRKNLKKRSEWRDKQLLAYAKFKTQQKNDD